MRILLIEDDKIAVETIKDELKNYFIVETALSGEAGENLAYANHYDLIILDYLLPDVDGITLCKRLRDNGIQSPILMLTGQDEVQKKVSALNEGADDYVTKPFHFDELIARIRALLRRQSKLNYADVLSVDDLTLDTGKKVVKRHGKVILLRRKELYLLEYLMRNAGTVVTRDMIFDNVWDSSNDSVTNTIDVHIKYLRDNVDRPFKKKLIKTVHGLGYKMEAENK